MEKVARQLPANRLLSLLKIPTERVATKTPNAEKSRESSARFEISTGTSHRDRQPSHDLTLSSVVS